MEKKIFGSSTLKTDPIIFGGNVFGWTLNEKESFRMLDELLEKGYHTIDTADVYSRWAEGNQGGESETIMGKWMKDRGVRDQIGLHTKVGSDMGSGHKDISKSYILKAVEDSLKRLQTDYIDLYYTHWDDDKTPVEETLEAYQILLKQGKIRHIGASNLSPQRLKESLEASSNKGIPKYEVFQQQYNLVERNDFEGEIKEICVGSGVGVSTYSSLASGFLTGGQNYVDIFGPTVVTVAFIIIGVALAGKAIFHFKKAYNKEFMDEYSIADLKYSKLAKNAGYLGYYARAVVEGILAFFFLKAGLYSGQNEIKGTQDAFSFLQDSSYGNILLGLVAGGLACYGIFVVLLSKHKKFDA